MKQYSSRAILTSTLAIAATLCADSHLLSSSHAAQSVHPRVKAAEQQRIEAIAKASQATVAIFDSSGQGGGSGVLISPDGFALSNFHVTSACGEAMKCGLSDGKLYDAVIVSIDPVGDVALIQLLGRDDFPVAQIGDSDQVQAGDWAFAAGNPFLLADDFTPTITYGMVSGVNRYQFPAGTLLEYTDCIQTDAAINPGNSGGPLFSAEGKLIGINGRGSFEKRGRKNVGVGYAISINQIMKFLGHLKSGRVLDHATLGATVSTDDQGRVIVDDILETSDAYRRGLRYGDTILEFAGREITTANALQNVLGVFPSGWTTSLTYTRKGEVKQTFVRLMGLHDRSELIDMIQQEQQPPGMPDQDEEEPEKEKPKLPELPDIPGLDQLMNKPKIPKIVADRYVARRGYANYWYNLRAQEKLFSQLQDSTGFSQLGESWNLNGKLATGKVFELNCSKEEARLNVPWGKFQADFTTELTEQLSPPKSGGLLLALHMLQRLTDKGIRIFGEVYYLGQLPVGPEQQLADCLVGVYSGMELRLYFHPKSARLFYLELWSSDDTDPCEIEFLDDDDQQGKQLPSRWIVRHGDALFADLHMESWEQPIEQEPDDQN